MALCFLLTCLNIFFLFFLLWPFNQASPSLSRVIYFLPCRRCIAAITYASSISYPDSSLHFFLPVLPPLGLSGGSVYSLACTLPFSMNSILFMSSVRFSEVRVHSNHLEKDKKYKLCSRGTSEKREERVGLWGAWLSSAALQSISQNTTANK